jgi:hypothetical protein
MSDPPRFERMRHVHLRVLSAPFYLQCTHFDSVLLFLITNKLYRLIWKSSAVDIMTRLQAQKSGFRIPAGARGFFLVHNAQAGSAAQTGLHAMGTGGALSRGKVVGT